MTVSVIKDFVFNCLRCRAGIGCFFVCAGAKSTKHTNACKEFVLCDVKISCAPLPLWFSLVKEDTRNPLRLEAVDFLRRLKSPIICLVSNNVNVHQFHLQLKWLCCH